MHGGAHRVRRTPSQPPSQVRHVPIVAPVSAERSRKVSSLRSRSPSHARICPQRSMVQNVAAARRTPRRACRHAYRATSPANVSNASRNPVSPSQICFKGEIAAVGFRESHPLRWSYVLSNELAPCIKYNFNSILVSAATDSLTYGQDIILAERSCGNGMSNNWIGDIGIV